MCVKVRKRYEDVNLEQTLQLSFKPWLVLCCKCNSVKIINNKSPASIAKISGIGTKCLWQLHISYQLFVRDHYSWLLLVNFIETERTSTILVIVYLICLCLCRVVELNKIVLSYNNYYSKL